MKYKKSSQAGLSLVELLMVVLLLSIILGALFSQINRAQTRYGAESQKIDLTQEEREFIDQFTRDLHQAGYPNAAIYGNTLPLNSAKVAAGIWYISNTDLWLEGDLDGDGFVEETQYHYDDGSTWAGPGPNPCPCIKRSSVAKTKDDYPWNQGNPVYYSEVQNIIAIPGQPFFTAYQADGTPVDLSVPILLGSGSALNTAAQSALHAIKSVRITITAQALSKDADAHKDIQVTMNGTARLPNN
jgi:type II secretory pathway pseudopilin PulG